MFLINSESIKKVRKFIGNFSLNENNILVGELALNDYSGCKGSCFGCTGGCVDSCSGDCSGGCYGGCEGGCYGGCQGSSR